MGRPTIYSEELALAICTRIAGGETLRSICEDAGMPDKSTIDQADGMTVLVDHRAAGVAADDVIVGDEVHRGGRIDPPRFGIAGELYSQAFYHQLARVLRPGGRLFHYTGSPNKLTSGRDVPREVATRLEIAGFKSEPVLDGVQGVRR